MAAKRKSDYSEILVRRGVVSPEQLTEAQQLASEAGIRLPEALVRLGYATGEDVMRAMAEQHGLDYVNLAEVNIPPSVVELVPESVARERCHTAFGNRWQADRHRQRPDGLRYVR